MNRTGFLDRLDMWANIRTATGSLAIVLVILALFGQGISPWLERRMGGEPVLDVMFRRSPEDVHATLEAYGVSGRRWYRDYLAVDALFPLLYSPLLAISVAFAARQLHVPERFMKEAMMLPFVGGAVDWGENLLLWIQAGRFPHQGEHLSWVAGAFTVLKFAALITAGLISLAGLAMAGVRAVRRTS